MTEGHCRHLLVRHFGEKTSPYLVMAARPVLSVMWMIWWKVFTGYYERLCYPVNIGNPDEISLKDFAEEIIKLTGTTQKIVYKPLPADDPKQRKPDITKAKEILGWEPKVSRAEGLKITYDYFKSLPQEELYKQPKEFNS